MKEKILDQIVLLTGKADKIEGFIAGSQVQGDLKELYKTIVVEFRSQAKFLSEILLEL